MGVSELSGEITSHLAALGAGTRDRLVFAILTRDPHFIEDEPVTGWDGEVRVDITNTMEGVLLRFRDGALDSIRTTARRSGDYYPYPRPTALITGLDLSAATRQDVQAALGDPAPEQDDEVRYPVDGAVLTATDPDSERGGEVRYPVEGGVLTATFEGDQLMTVTVSRD